MKQGKIIVPPIKCQGIKTKLIPFIRATVQWNGKGRWIESFLGSGVVAFNMAPERALLTDKNEYIIRLYQGIQQGRITAETVRAFLELHGKKLAEQGNDYYLAMRTAFNGNHDPLYFLFLNRAGFNGLIRFNSQGGYNVPFCHNSNRFSRSYITKICNQVQAAADVMAGRDWHFAQSEWEDTVKDAQAGDYLYLDPPYIGRNTTYVGEWPEEEAGRLARAAHETPASVCLSMWQKDEVKKNRHLYQYREDFCWHEQPYFYFVGGPQTRRHAVVELLAVREHTARLA